MSSRPSPCSNDELAAGCTGLYYPVLLSAVKSQCAPCSLLSWPVASSREVLLYPRHWLQRSLAIREIFPATVS